MDKQIRHSHNVFSPHAFAAWMANCAAYQASVYNNNWTGHSDAPYATENMFLFRMFYQFADIVTSGKARHFFKMYTGSPIPILLWLTSVVDQATILVTSGVSDPIMVNHILSGEHASITSSKYYEAISLVFDTWDKFNKVITGTETPPVCLLVKNYEAEQAKRAQEKSRTNPRKNPPEHSPAPAEDLKRLRIARGPGDFFIWSKAGRMPFPTENDKMKRVCLMHARQGLTCSNPRCPMLHSPPSEWPSSTLEPWVKLVRKTEGLAFNADTVAPEIVMKSLNTRPK